MTVMIKKVGVIGSGQMGNGIAHVAALAGLDVVLNDVSADRLKSGMATINGNLSRQVAKKIITEDARKQALARIVSTETMDGLADCDLVIESAVEKEEVKRKIFHDVCAVLKPEAIVASNTSSISITRLAASTDRWGCWSSPTLSAWTPVFRSCRCCTKDWRIPSTGPVRCS